MADGRRVFVAYASTKACAMFRFRDYPALGKARQEFKGRIKFYVYNNVREAINQPTSNIAI
jgi:hypothetical protein